MAASIKAEIKGENLIITLPFSKTGYTSPSGKTQVHASSKGNVPTEVMVEGKPLIIGLNAYTSKK